MGTGGREDRAGSTRDEGRTVVRTCPLPPRASLPHAPHRRATQHTYVLRNTAPAKQPARRSSHLLAHPQTRRS